MPPVTLSTVTLLPIANLPMAVLPMAALPMTALTATGARPDSRLRRWLFKTRGPEAGEVFLNQRRVFIVPTRYGLFFAFSLLAFLAASINYDLALGFVLTFFLAAAGLVAMLHTFRNLAHLYLRPLKADPVFAGEPAHFELVLDNRRNDERAALWLKSPHAHSVHDLPPRHALTVTLMLPTGRRGWLPAPRITLETRYPLGLLRAWSYWEPDLCCLVYPRPAPHGAAFPELPDGSGEGAPRGTGTDDFAGLRDLRDNDNPRLIAWRRASLALATDAPLPAKHFTGSVAAQVILDIDLASGDLETRIALLTRWVLDADAAGLSYGLKLREVEFAPARGEGHRLACLHALALVEPVPAAA